MLSPELRKQMAERSLVSVGRQIPWKQFLAKPHKCLGFFGGCFAFLDLLDLLAHGVSQAVGSPFNIGD